MNKHFDALYGRHVPYFYSVVPHMYVARIVVALILPNFTILQAFEIKYI